MMQPGNIFSLSPLDTFNQNLQEARIGVTKDMMLLNIFVKLTILKVQELVNQEMLINVPKSGKSKVEEKRGDVCLGMSLSDSL